METNGTWVLEDLPPTKKALECKWVYKIKYNSDGTVERYKARLVILGNRQIEGIDYTKMLAPVSKMVTVRVFLTVTAARNWKFIKWTFTTLFFMAIFMKKSTSSCRLGSKFRLPTNFVSSKSLYMGLNRLLAAGLPNSQLH